MMADCYCRTCAREFKSLGIARHRAMHRDRKEVCAIVFNKIGEVKTWDYRDKKMTNEELKAAIELVQRHQDWRRGAEIEMENPKELGVSIDTVLKSASELSQLKEGTHPDMVLVPRGSCIEAMEDAFRSVYGISISAAFRQHDNTVIANAFIQGWKNAMLSAAQKGND